MKNSEHIAERRFLAVTSLPVLSSSSQGFGPAYLGLGSALGQVSLERWGHLLKLLWCPESPGENHVGLEAGY